MLKRMLHIFTHCNLSMILLIAISTIICTIIICFASASTDEIYRATFIENNHARMDIQPTVGDGINLNPKTDAKLSYPDWIRNKHGQGMMVTFNINNDWKEYSIRLLPNRNGVISIILRGPWNDRNIPIVVEYRNLKINSSKIDIPSSKIWHDEPFKYILNVKEKQPVEISVEIKKPSITVYNIMKNQNFNSYVLCSLVILLLFFFRRVFAYISDKKNNYADMCFIIIFFMTLFLPMSYISSATESKQENRVLAVKPSLVEKGDLNIEFGKAYETWFNDHFWGRNYLISLSSKITLYLNHIYVKGKALFIPDNNWMFTTQALTTPTSEQHKKIVNSLITINKLCEQNGIKLYLLIVPHKNSIYKDILYKNYSYNNAEIDDFNNYVKKLEKDVNIKVIYPYLELLKARDKDFVYFKQSHHWTDWGAYNGYTALIETISKDFDDFTEITLDYFKQYTSKLIRDGFNDGFNIGHTTNLLNFSENYAIEHLLNDNYKYYDAKKAVKPNINRNIKVFSNPSGKYKIFITGNSQNDNLMNFLPYSANKLKYIRLNQGNYLSAEEENKFLKYYRKDLLEFKPDIFIISITAEDIIKYLQQMVKD